jgi:membrane-associated phospholipid phosphatase
MASSSHTVAVTVLVSALILIIVLQQCRLVGGLVSAGVVLGLGVGVSATVLAAHLA